jgi:putative acetyltransferase
MRPTIATESPLSADGRALIAESQLALEAVYPPEEIFSLTPEELDREAAAFLVARDGAGRAQGCVALVDCGGYGEVKRLYVRPEGRGLGLARALMAAIEAEARGRDLAEVLLETGNRLGPAVALYERLGYRTRGPFGVYPEHPASLFMTKAVA